MYDYLHLLQPQDVPNVAALRGWNDWKSPAHRDALRLNGETWEGAGVAAHELHGLLSDLTFSKIEDAGLASAADDSVHDEYFYVRRINGDQSEIFFRTLVWTNWIFLRDVDEAPCRIGAKKLNRLDDAFKALQARMLGTAPPAATRINAWQSTGAAHHSMQRWIRGHQVFAALTQGLIAAFRELHDALAHGERRRIDDAVALALVLLRGSGAALEFTGDLPTEDYTNIIRPSMTPPLVPETFSGLLSTDHRIFVQLLRDMKPALDALHQQNPTAHEAIAQAVREVYDSHGHVCDRLVGKSPSLMMSAVSKKTGVDQIERFKALRLKAFDIAGRSNPASMTSDEAASA